ncbi:hypothetical protein HQ39_06040 [Porphyromonas sp. COT-108 OH2963]|uniref:DUF3160 domain-containing protein n=1 Tax=Porphyromonas sp. COT-108 OH2963 TaxID=1515614 RepID=UPI00052CB2AE|nr:DUF3160 domain-containing protein [Porphyromonas sp. COT-108 OH2963]KGN95774.1 hypothetical protein HQ39_06040 [Porphyromonas sp. COT-108 OH2963]
MKKLASVICLILVIAIGGCTSKKENSGETPAEKSVPFFGDSMLPRSLDLNQEIEAYTMEELLLLRNYPYAIHGLYFMDANINGFFSSSTDWYTKLYEEAFEQSEENGTHFPTEYSDITLSPEEAAFVARVDKRIEELKKEQYIVKGNLRLGKTKMIVNDRQFPEVDSLFMKNLEAFNFTIAYGTHEQLFHLYEQNDYENIPSFITTDLFLQTFHMYFSYVLKSLEKEIFIPAITEISESMYRNATRISKETGEEKIKALAEYTAAFYAIPYYLLTGEKLPVAEKYENAVAEEIKNILKEKSSMSAFLATGADFPFDLFKPRGNYTRSEQTKAYFRAMMWLQVAYFCLDGDEDFEKTLFQAILLRDSKTREGKSIEALYDGMYSQTVFLVGESDNLSVMDVVGIMRKKNISKMGEALSAEGIATIRKEMKSLALQKNKISPKIELTCHDKINFMPQRYLPDNEILQELVDITPDSKRAFPKGLDVFAANGLTQAEDILKNFYKEEEMWSGYSGELDSLKEKFRTYKPAEPPLYNRWLESLFTMVRMDKNVPDFMKTKEWGYKNLNTALASWAELKHDAILYGEQPVAAECGGGGLPDPYVKGYVEPNLPFWEKMNEILDVTKALLEKHNCLTKDLESKTDQLQGHILFLIDVTKKELAGENLTENDHLMIGVLGSYIEDYTLSILDPGTFFSSWTYVKGPDRSVAVVADIYTRNVLECNKQGVLHVGTGYVNPIYVVVEIDGFLYLTRGATFSYYEFVRPLNERLTDEEWQKLLEEEKAPGIPDWMKPLVVGKAPKSDDREQYSSGC